MIGGKSKSKTKAPEDIDEVPTQPKPETGPSTSSPKQGRPSTLDEVSAAPEPSRKKPAERPSAPPVPQRPPETEKEKADRRREELKRELEAKENAPTKKKRRF